MNMQKGAGTATMVITLVVALALVWFISSQIGNLEDPSVYQFEKGDTSYMNDNGEYVNYEEVVITEDSIVQGEAEVEAISETSSSDELSDIESDMDFDIDGATRLDDFE